MPDFAVHEQLRRNYDGYYDGASEWRRLGALDKADTIVRLARDRPHESVLDIGAGEGAVLERLAALGFGSKLHAVEISESGAQVIRDRGIPNLVECRLFDGYTLPYDDGAFDLAILSHVLEHAEYPRRLLYEAGRVAASVCVLVPLEDFLFMPRDYTPDTVGHINFYSPKTIRRLVQSCGFEVTDQVVETPSRAVHRYSAGRLGTLKWLVKTIALRLSPRLATILLPYHGGLLCRKTPD